MDGTDCGKNRCVIVGGADIGDYERTRGYLKDGDYVIYCDSGLRHMEHLGAAPSLIVGDWDSHEDPRMDVETITLPVAKDDTDTAYAVKEGMKRGYSEFLLIGVIGARLDHTLVNTYILTSLENRGCHGVIIDDYSEMELICSRTIEPEPVSEADGLSPGKTCPTQYTVPGTATVGDRYQYFSLVAIEGDACGVTIRNAKFCIDDAVIGPDYQYATSNEPLPGLTSEITVQKGRLLLIRIIE